MIQSSKGVFLSYASEDAGVAKRICEALRIGGIEVWFDQSELRGGDAWDQKIRQQIRDCALFVPIISAHTQTRPEGYFRLEWKLAVDRSHLMAAEKAFLVPVVVDGTPEPEALVPTQFRDVQWTRIRASEVPAAFVDRIAALLIQPVASHLRSPERVVSRAAARRLPIVLIAISIAAVAALAIATAMRGGWLPHKPESKNEAGTDSASMATSSTTISEQSVAVLPFVDMSKKKDQEYFSDGLAEELMNLLSQLPELHVAARTSAFSFKDKSEDIPTIGKKLHVATILEGSVRKSGSKLRVTAQLVRADNGYQLWSQIYDREFGDIFRIQDEIAAAVVFALKVPLLKSELPRVRRTDPNAYALQMQARYLNSQGTNKSIEQAIALDQQAVRLDPAYAAAWNGLAQDYINQAYRGTRPAEEGYRLAREAANKAIAIDPTYASAYARLGKIALAYERDLAGAARAIEHALALDPANISAIDTAAQLLTCLGRVKEAVSLFEYIAARDPASPISHGNLAISYLQAGRLDDAVASVRIAQTLNPRYDGMNFVLGLSLLFKGDGDAALASMLQEQDPLFRLTGLAMTYHTLGRATESDTALSELLNKYEQDAAYNISLALAWRGESDRAFEWLNRAAAQQGGVDADITVEAGFARIHSDPRWPQFLKRIGMSKQQLKAIKFDVRPPRA